MYSSDFFLLGTSFAIPETQPLGQSGFSVQTISHGQLAERCGRVVRKSAGIPVLFGVPSILPTGPSSSTFPLCPQVKILFKGSS